MSGTGIFLYGLGVTIVVGIAVAFLAYGAILDGRYEREMRERMRTGKPDDRYASTGEVMQSVEPNAG